jgi:hypothetical protein
MTLPDAPPDATPEATPAPRPIGRLLRFYEQNERTVDITFFAGGFLFDVFTLTRVDAWLGVAQQVVYLFVTGTILLHIFFDEGKPPRRLEGMPALKRWYFEYRMAAVHFLLGRCQRVHAVLLQELVAAGPSRSCCSSCWSWWSTSRSASG